MRIISLILSLLTTAACLQATATGPLKLRLSEIAPQSAPFAHDLGDMPKDTVGLDFSKENRKAVLMLDEVAGNWTGGVKLRLRIYSASANQAPLVITFTPAGGDTPEGFGTSYWFYKIHADWVGWKNLEIDIEDLTAAHKDGRFLPNLFPRMDKVEFYNFGWDTKPPHIGNFWALDTLEVFSSR